jgi:hypothetical protein
VRSEEARETKDDARLSLLTPSSSLLTPWKKVVSFPHRRVTMRTRTPMILAALALVLCVTASAQQVVTVTGTAAILNRDTAQARDRAVESALRAAVEQVVGTMVDSESMVKNNELLSDKIFTQTKGYIASYNILSEKPDMDSNIYSVRVEATVKQGNLQNDLNSLGVLMRRMKMPRVAVALREEVYETASTTLIRLLKDKGFLMVDTGGREPWRQSTFWTIKENEQVDLLGKYGAEVVILGTAAGSGGAQVGNSAMRGYQGTVSMKALKSDTHEVLGSATATGKAVDVSDAGIDQALRQAVTVAGNDLMKQITSQWAQETSSTRVLTLEILTKNLAKVQEVSKRLQTEGRGIQEVVVRQSGAGGAELSVSMQGDASELAQEMLKLYPKVRIVSQSANRLTVEF